MSDRKNISAPNIIFEPYVGQNYAGAYYSGHNLMVIVERDDIDISEVIAHEYRHHIQWETGKYYDELKRGSYFDHSLPWEEAIVKYFKTQKSEFDALLYSYKITKSEQSHYWLKHLVMPNNLNLTQ